uniref:Uncharacterized protein n=1 Tax=Rhizophora mucronata TaxID=61149 RepID=A0A2P2KA39_RHIMU
METGSLSKALPVERDCAAHLGNKSLDLKSGPSLSCATGSLEKKDAMKIWLEMKENGFLTPAHAQVPTPKKLCTKRSRSVVRSKVGIEKVKQVHRLPHVAAAADGLAKEIDPGIKCSGGILPTPKQCGERHKIDMDGRKVKVARVQQDTGFTKIAASSGLLDKLNPGIVSRIRNSDEVFSAIGALVKSNGLRNGNLQSKQTEYMQKRVRGNDGSECSNTLQGSSPLGICPMSPSRQMHMTSEHQTEFGHLGTAMTRVKNEVDIDELTSQSSLSNFSDSAISYESNEESTKRDAHPSLPQEGWSHLKLKGH